MAGIFEVAAMRRALDSAALGPAYGPNPRVGCVILDASGSVVGEGWHDGAGTPHAEVAALAAAGAAARGGTAVVTLEPCNPTGRTAQPAGGRATASSGFVPDGCRPSPGARTKRSRRGRTGVHRDR